MKSYSDHRKRIGALTLHYFNYPGARTLLVKWREREWRWCLEYRLRFTVEQVGPLASRFSDSVTTKRQDLAVSEAGPRHAMAAVDEQERVA